MAQIDKILQFMVQQKGSDLHLSSDAPPYIRVDGDLLKMNLPSLNAEQVKGLIYEIMPEHNRQQYEKTSDTDFAYSIEGLARFRVNIFVDRKGPGLVMRTIPSEILSCETLGVPEKVRELSQLPKGLVVVTGPTGSGKSTTLASLVDECNTTRKDHIITIEDPIEFVHQNKECLVNQREVHVHTQGFNAALRAALREDPDIVLIGEMRDLETVSIAIETAETGHLVFGTLHTTTAATTVDRIIDQFPADQQDQIRTMLSTSLKAVVAQTLLKKRGGGRIAAMEILIVSAAVANLIREGKTYNIPSSMETGKKQGNMPLSDLLVSYVERRLVDPLEAYMKAIDKLGYSAKITPVLVNLVKTGQVQPMEGLKATADRDGLLNGLQAAGMAKQQVDQLRAVAAQIAGEAEG
ncbi:MAG: type IV pilus twitching motility protein PilT [Planctomycetota bacterium]|jgi:twitching motility protein PilT|nr:type IV pilus twitching motility protein PilT [Planctomycetota bacterium]MDP7250591.1 type IV pilus twitching motility protein PilT [Planctomycetota bacterium]